jgi:integrase
MHPTTCVVLGAYLRQRERMLDRRDSPYVFPSRRGKRLDIGHVHRTFYALSRQIGLRGPHDSHGPRPHDLRHNSGSRIIPGEDRRVFRGSASLFSRR